ncbi:HEAT repeat domain-containing protein [Tundrisphaera sp. TA3]|uniref:HEAT repeat domain-containing protein n=1 Tax=Tundrisphaera sp. TA3 TaxID=3435775 RepID=UPI003EBB4640
MPFTVALLIALASRDNLDLLRQKSAVLAESPSARAVVAAVRRREDAVMRETLEAFLATKEWSEVLQHGGQLALFGDRAVQAVAEALRRKDLDERTVRDCYQWLLQRFPEHRLTIRIAIGGCSRTDVAGIRYECVFFLGQHRVYGAHRALRRVLEDHKLDEMIRYTAAKSLAELGEPDAIRTLYEAAGSHSYMHRYVAHIGFLAIAGKSPDDFGGYQYGEGTAVSGGIEYQMAIDGITLAERRAGRYRALADFCAWLKAERPHLYKHLTAGVF